MPFFETLSRTLRLGRWRYFKGYDLDGNKYFELPNGPHGRPKRTVDYRIARDWGEYNDSMIPAQWSAWLRTTRKLPPTMDELQKDYDRQLRLKANVMDLERAYQAEKAAALDEAQRVAQLQPPRQIQQRQQISYPSQSQPSIAPAGDMARTHPPSQQYGSSIPRSMPDDRSFPSIAQSTPERRHMAAALDQTAGLKLGRDEKEAQLREGRAATTTLKRESRRQPDAPATPADDFKPEDWAPSISQRR